MGFSNFRRARFARGNLVFVGNDGMMFSTPANADSLRSPLSHTNRSSGPGKGSWPTMPRRVRRASWGSTTFVAGKLGGTNYVAGRWYPVSLVLDWPRGRVACEANSQIVATNVFLKFDDRMGHVATTDRFDALSDIDRDGMPGEREQAYGLDLHDPTDAGRDPDGDGLSTLEEYRSGTDPYDEGSLIRIIECAPVGGQFLMRFPTLRGRSSRLETCTSLMADSWELPPKNLLGTGDIVEVVLPFDASLGSGFYRIR